MDILITGGSGFIGSNLARSLVASEHRVRVLDDLSTGDPDNLLGLDGRVDLEVGDIRDPETVRRLSEGAEVVYHLAALPSVVRSVADPVTTSEVNVGGTLNVLQAAREARVRRVVYASSSSIYGDTPTLPKHEEMAPVPLSPYAAAKLSGEAYCRAFTSAFGLETVSLRFFNVFGPRQDPTSEYAAVIPRFATRMLAGEPPEIFGDGSQSRDFTFVDNAVRALELAAGAGPAATGQAMNIGCDERITLLDLVAILNELLEIRLEPVFGPPRPGDVRHSLASIAKAAELIGYRPQVGVREGIARTVEWLAAGAEPTIHHRR